MIEQASIQAVSVGGQTVLEVAGEVDLVSSPAVHQAVVSLIERGESDLILDLRGVTFMDSSGLNVLAGAARRLGTSAVLVVGCPPNLQRLLKLSGLEAVLRMYDTVEAAVEDLP